MLASAAREQKLHIFDSVSENADCCSDGEPAEAPGKRTRAKRNEESLRDTKGIFTFTQYSFFYADKELQSKHSLYGLYIFSNEYTNTTP